jgi:hypothetical protein
MASWRFGIGNLVSRAANAPVAVAPAVEDPLLPLVNLGSGYPDEQGGLTWRSDGAYAIDFDLNLLAVSSERADAPAWGTNFTPSTAALEPIADPKECGLYNAPQGRSGASRLKDVVAVGNYSVVGLPRRPKSRG